MIATLHTLVTDLQHHPILTDPLPYPSSFTDQQAYRLYLQLRNTLRHLGTISTDLCQGIRILQFLPGSPGSPGHYRMDPILPVSLHPPPRTSSLLQSYHLPTDTSTQPNHLTWHHEPVRVHATGPPRPLPHLYNIPRSSPTHLTVPLSQTLQSLTATAVHCTNLFGHTSAPSSSPSPTPPGTWSLRPSHDHTGSSH